MPTSSRALQHPSGPFDDAPRAALRPPATAPPLGVRPVVDRFGKDAGVDGEPVITPQPGRLVAPLRNGLRLGRLGRAGGGPLGGPGAKARM